MRPTAAPPTSSSPTASPRSSRRPPRSIARAGRGAPSPRGAGFAIALAGGSTPRALYPHLVDRHRLDAHRRLLRRRARGAARRSAVELPHGARDAARPGARPRRRTCSAGAPRTPISTPPRATTSRRCARARRARLARPGAARPRSRRPHRVAVSRARRRWPCEDRLAVAVDVPALGDAPPDAHLSGAARRWRGVLPGDRRATSGPRWPTSSAPAARSRRAHRPATAPACIFCDARPRALTDINPTRMTVLAGDIGGTNTRLAIYDVPASGRARR